ncbi:hypothetical protein [Rhodococcus sp. NCIMB 12038]|nr:hypothetical protein [Rhodococcus sp. NCIMB 12038]
MTPLKLYTLRMLRIRPAFDGGVVDAAAVTLTVEGQVAQRR